MPTLPNRRGLVRTVLSVCVALTAALTCLPTAAAAQAQERRVYEGAEAQALKCAWIIARTGNLLEAAGLIPAQDRDISIAISGRILELHVSGTQGQKLAALQQVGARRDSRSTVQEFQSQAFACLRKFPVE